MLTHDISIPHRTVYSYSSASVTRSRKILREPLLVSNKRRGVFIILM